MVGESNLTYDGTNLQLITDANNEGIKLNSTSTGSSYPVFEMDANRSVGNTLGKLISKWNGTEVASIQITSGTDGTNKDDAHMYFNTASAGTPVERLRINSTGDIGVNFNGTPVATLDIRTNRDPSNGLMCFIRNNAQYGNGAFYGMDVNSVGTWSVGMPDNTNALSFRNGGQGGDGTEYLRISSNGTLTQTSTKAFQIAKGTTAQRPSSPVVGMVRFNTTTNALENYNSTGWANVNTKIPIITSITGNIYAGMATNLTINGNDFDATVTVTCLLYTSPSPRD